MMLRCSRLLVAISLLVALAAPVAVQAQETVVVFLTRHAERQEDGTRDPPISAAGESRSELLATILADAGVTHVHSTDLKRTRQTAAPIVARTGLEIQLYDPFDLPGFADELRRTPGRHLVSGHSNTTPDLVAALGGDPGSPIDEHEYDRLYIVTISPSGVETVLLRYGDPAGG